MASDQSFVTFICDQAGIAGQISFRKMFGEYVIYCRGRVVALVCGNQLFVKPTSGGKAALGTCVEASPYPGAKPHYLIADRLDDRNWLSELIVTTASQLAEPKRRRSKAKKVKTTANRIPLKKGTDRSVHFRVCTGNQSFAEGDRVVCPLFQHPPKAKKVKTTANRIR